MISDKRVVQCPLRAGIIAQMSNASHRMINGRIVDPCIATYIPRRTASQLSWTHNLASSSRIRFPYSYRGARIPFVAPLSASPAVSWQGTPAVN
jgi:hypothetical protein